MSSPTDTRLEEALDRARQGDLQTATNICEEILLENASDDGAYYVMGLIAHAAGNPNMAIQFLGRALELNPMALGPLLALAELTEEIGEIERTRTLLEQGAALQPDAAEIWMAKGALHRREGDFEAATGCYETALALDPDLIGASLELAATLEAAGRVDDALAALRKARGRNPQAHEILFNIGNTLQRAGRHEEAVAAYEQAESIKPGYQSSIVNRAQAERARGNAAQAIAIYRELLKQAPDLVPALNNLAAILAEEGQEEEAIRHLRHSLKILPEQPEVIVSLSLLLGQALANHGQAEDAATAFRQALLVDPDRVEALNNLGLALTNLGRLEEAEEHLRRAAELAPDSVVVCLNLAATVSARGRHSEAVALCKQLLNRHSDNADIRIGLGNALQDLGALDEAATCFDAILGRDPRAAFNKGLVRLSQGHLDEGWKLHEARLQTGAVEARPLPWPRWSGKKVDQPVLIWGEQGLGDEITFASCLPDAIATGAPCVIEVEERLVSLFARSFPEAKIISHGTPLNDSGIGCQIPMGSLASLFRPSVESFSGRKPHLKADPDLVEHWRQRVAALGPGPKIGIAWRSRLMLGTQRLRHFAPLAEWQKLLQVEEAIFINLQYDDCAEEIDAMKQATGTTVLRMNDLDLFNDFEGQAGLMKALDLVISAPVVTLSLAGALGCPTWLISRPDWPMLGTDGFPWAPSVRCITCPTDRTWSSTFDRAAALLKTFVTQSRHGKA